MIYEKDDRILYRNIGGKIQLVERGYADLFPTWKYMEINNLPLLRSPKKSLRGSDFVPKYRGKIQPPLKLVERGYADLFPTRKHMKINNAPLLRSPERLQEDLILYQNIEVRFSSP